MSLPPRSFFLLTETAVRWSAMPADIVGWAMDGMLSLSAVLPPVEIAPSRMLSGLLEIAACDVLPMFRRDGTSVKSIMLRRARENSDVDWQWITAPAEGVAITPADVLIPRAEVERFEREHGLFAAATAARALPERRRAPGPGAPQRHDWDAFYAALARRVHDYGIPASLAELVCDMQDWFDKRDDGAPDESTIRKKATIIWRELSQA